ncbi:MAG: VTT domain-containing protein [Gammaproteobacteria bacterium]
MTAYLFELAQWIGQHPLLAGLAVFAVAFSESLALVGLLVPGAVLMVAAGALIGTGNLPFWPLFAWAVAGAVAGDGISFWLGYHYRDALREIGPFRSHPEWLQRAEGFIHKHGGKSVLLGRFVGPVRPIVPAVAGMMGMRPALFATVNVLSALAWAPAYLLPGMAFGASLAIAGQVSARLAALLAVLVAGAAVVVWVGRHVFRAVRYSAGALANRALAWGGRHPLLGRITGGLLDPHRPPSRALLSVAGLLVASVISFFMVLEAVLSGDPLLRADHSVYALLLHLRSPWGDQVMTVFTELGDAAVLTPLSVLVAGRLAWRREWLAEGYWLSAIGFGLVATHILKWTLELPRPVELYANSFSVYGFPSAHAAMGTVIYGFLAVFLAQGISVTYRWIPYVAASLLVTAIAFSRLYLGAHWMSDVLAGLTLGVAWVAFLAIAYHHHQARTNPLRGLRYGSLAVFLIAAGWHVATQHAADLQRYAPRHPLQRMELARWWDDGWKSMPRYRIDLGGDLEQPLNLQWAAPLVQIRSTLEASGWIEPTPLQPTTALRWLLPAPGLRELPLLPQLSEGRRGALVMIRPAAQAGTEQLMIRLWPASVRLQPGGAPLWVGYVAATQLYDIAFLHVPHAANDFDGALTRLRRSLTGVTLQRIAHAGRAGEDGARFTLLLRSPAAQPSAH